MDENPYRAPVEGDPTQHSRLGIASFAIGLVALSVEVLLLWVGSRLEVPGKDETLAAALGVGLFGAIIFNVVSIGFGIFALRRTHRKKKLFGVLGILISSGTILFFSFRFVQIYALAVDLMEEQERERRAVQQRTR